MRRIFKWVGLFLAVVILAAVALPFLVDANRFKPTLESELSAALNREVKLGNLKFSLLSGEVAADDLSVAEDQAFGKPAFIQAKSLRVGAEIWPFLVSRKLVVTYLTIEQPEIALVQTPTGDWNFSSLGGKSQRSPQARPEPGATPLDLSVKQVKITNGRLTLKRTIGHWKPVVLDQVALDLRDFSASSAFPFTLTASVVGGGAVQLNGKAGPINPTDAAMTPVETSLKLTRLDLAGSGMNDFAPDLAGLVTFDATASSDGRTMQIEGKIQGDKLKFSRKGTPAERPVEFDFNAQHDLRKHSGSVRKGDIHIGAAVAHLTGTYAAQGEEMVLNMKLRGPDMPVSELEAMLPALGVVLPAGSRLDGGDASIALSMDGPADKLVTSGTLAMNHTRLAGFDLPKKMSTIEKLAGIKGGPDTEIQTLSADVRVSPEGTSAQNMKLVAPAIGDLSGGGTVSPANDLDFKMTATVQNTPIPFTVQGTCADPVFRPDMKALVKEQLKSRQGELEKAGAGLLKGLLGGKKR